MLQLSDPFKNRSKAKHRCDENGMDEFGLNDAAENDRNATNVNADVNDDDASNHRLSVSSTLIRNSEMSIFGSRRSIFRRSTKLSPNPSIITSIQVDENYQSTNAGEPRIFLTLCSEVLTGRVLLNLCFEYFKLF